MTNQQTSPIEVLELIQETLPIMQRLLTNKGAIPYDDLGKIIDQARMIDNMYSGLIKQHPDQFNLIEMQRKHNEILREITPKLIVTLPTRKKHRVHDESNQDYSIQDSAQRLLDLSAKEATTDATRDDTLEVVAVSDHESDDEDTLEVVAVLDHGSDDEDVIYLGPERVTIQSEPRKGTSPANSDDTQQMEDSQTPKPH